jgi:hypothetical protein
LSHPSYIEAPIIKPVKKSSGPLKTPSWLPRSRDSFSWIGDGGGDAQGKRPLESLAYVVFDLETTGLDTRNDAAFKSASP